MRTLTDTLTAAQQAKSLSPLVKITLTQGANTLVLEEDRLRKLAHIEEPYRINAKEAEFDNSAGYFTTKDLKGYKAVISWGLLTKAGKEYSNTSPMWVTWQQLNSTPGRLSCLLTMLGIPDLMDQDEASESYLPAENDTKTVKTLIDEIAGATLACYSHCQAYEVVWESGYDTLADTYKPKDSFRVYIGGSRLAAIKRLMEYMGNGLRYGADGKIHILKPQTTGTPVYTYSLKSGHTFFSKAYRKTLILPNYIVVRSRPDDDPQYSGYAQDAESYALLPKRKYVQTRLQSDDEAEDIAKAILSKYKLNAEMGSADALMNCGAELFDYVKVTDEREGDYRIGNIGSLTRTYNAEKHIYNMRFSFGDPPIVQHIKELYQDLKKAAEREGGSFERLYAQDAYIEQLWIDNINAVWLDPENNIDLSKIGDTLDSLPDGEVFARVKSLHIDAGKIKLDENILYKAGYNPITKMPGDADLDDIGDGSTYQRLLATQIEAGKIKLTSEAVFAGEWYSESGVEIDASHGINIYGKNNALTTRATKDGAIQCYVGSDGRLNFQGTDVVTLRSATGVVKGWLGAIGSGINLVAASGQDIDLSAADINLEAEDALVLKSYYGMVELQSLDEVVKLLAESIYLYAPTLTEDIDAFGTTEDIGSWHRYDDIHCDRLYANSGPWDIYDDLALIKAIKPLDSDPLALDMNTVPDFLKRNKAKDMAKKERKLIEAENRHRERLQGGLQSLERVRDNPKINYAKAKHTLEQQIKHIGNDRQKRLNDYSKHLDEAIPQEISIGEATLLSLGALKQVATKFEDIESRLTALEAR